MVLTGSALWAKRLVQVLGLFAIGFVLTYAGIAWHAGYRPYIVHTGSMTPTYRTGDLVLVKRHAEFGVGSVITFTHGQGDDLVTHRIAAIGPRGITTKGDGNRTDDAWTIQPENVQGVAAGSLPGMGYVARFLQVPAGVGALVCSVLAMLLLWGIFFPGAPPAPRGPAVRVPRQRTQTSHELVAPATAAYDVRQPVDA